MRAPRRSPMTLVVLTLVSLTLMTVDLSDAGGGPVEWLRRGAVTVFAPVQHAVATLARPFGAAARWVGDQRDLHAELERTRAALAELEATAAQRDDLRAENAQLRRLLGMRERLGVQTVGARVLGTPPGDPRGTVLIDAGAADGLAPGMTVTDGHGIVGRLVVVTERHARVELVTSPQARYAVRVVPGGHAGRMRGRGDGGIDLELNDPHAQVPAGATVVTRAFTGSAVPEGLLVGTVEGDPATGRHRPVRPAFAAADLRVVQVLLSSPQGQP